MNELTKVIMCDIFYNALKLCSQKKFFLFSLHIIISKSIRKKKLILIAIFLFKKNLKFRIWKSKYQPNINYRGIPRLGPEIAALHTITQ